MPSVTFASFTLEASPAVTDFLVGYRTAVAGGERRTTLSSLNSLFQANITSGLTANAVLVSGASSNLAASDLSYSTPTLTVPASFGITGAGSLAFTAGGSNQNITLTPSGTGYADFRFNATPTASIGFSAGIRNFSRDSTAALFEGISYGNSVVFTGLRYGGTAAALAATPTQQTIVRVSAYGYDGSAVVGGRAEMRLMSSQAFSPGANGTYIGFAATPDGSTTMGDVLYLGNSDGLGSQWAGVSATRISGGAGNMTIQSGTGASRTLTFRTTTAGSVVTDAATFAADQSLRFPSTNTAGLQLYNTVDQTTNYERGALYFTGNEFIVGTEAGGTGTNRTLRLRTGASLTSVIALTQSNSNGRINFTASSSSAASFLGFTFDSGSTATSGTNVMWRLTPTYNQASGTAANTDLLINRTQTAVGSGAQLLADFQVGSSSQWRVSNNGTVTQAGALITTPQALSGAGAVNLTTTATNFTSTGGAQALTLANGTDGQIKTITHVVDGGSGVLTPTTAIGFTTVTFTNVGDSVTLRYTSAGWAICGIYGAVAA